MSKASSATCFPPGRYTSSFPTLLWDFKDFLKLKGRVDSQDLQAIIRLSREHATANRVRHGFLPVGREEAVASSFNFLGFCRACGIEHAFLATLAESLKVWDEKVSPLQKSRELAKLRFDLFVAQRENRKLLEQAAGARDAEARAGQLDADLRQRTAELARERARADSRAERVDALRAELNAIGLQKTALAGELARYGELDAYLEHLNRFTIYTRTRRDYERSLMRLTAEQQEALDAITPGRDFLVRGGAGTGKTIVLLHAYGRARALIAQELGLHTPGRAVLLTYTTTLVKYDRYLAELLKASAGCGPHPDRRQLLPGAASRDRPLLEGGLRRGGDPGEEVEHDGLPVQRGAGHGDRELPLRPRGEQAGIRGGPRAPAGHAPAPLGGPARPGMGHPGAGGRRHGGEGRLQQELLAPQADRAPRGRRRGAGRHRCAFVDESQDLTAVDLRALKLMCARGVVMAGDAGQAIYGLGSPYKRAGIDIAGRTKILRTDFRTTCPIHDAAESYRQLCGTDIEGETVVTHAFREGPAPELYTARSREELAGLLVEKTSLFIEKLGYDPENITVLAPGKADVTAIRDRLSRRGIPSADIRDESFSFAAPGLVRVSTLHSSKGLDFPVVLLYLPSLPLSAEYDEAAAESLARNLIYVAMTRAMDNLNVFVMEECPGKSDRGPRAGVRPLRMSRATGPAAARPGTGFRRYGFRASRS